MTIGFSSEINGEDSTSPPVRLEHAFAGPVIRAINQRKSRQTVGVQ